MISKTKIIFGITIISLILFANSVLGTESSQQTNKIFLNPFYLSSMNQNTNYSYSLQLNPPDGLESVSSAIITIDAYINPMRTFYVFVNDKTCNTNNYVISTTFAGAGKATVYFDCSNVINKKGTYDVKIKVVGGNIGSSTAWADITYTTKPLADIKVHGTEYIQGQIAKAWLQLIDTNGTYVNGGVCYIDIYTPAGGEFLEGAQMINMNHDGIYYYDYDTTLLIDGVYPVIAHCYYLTGQTYNYASHYFLINGTYNAGTVTNTYTIENTVGGSLQFREEASGNPRRLQVGMNITNNSLCTDIPESLMTGIGVRTVGRFDSAPNDDLTISIWNYTSNSWLNLNNKLLEGNSWRDVSNSLSFNNITKAGLVNGSGSNIKIKYFDTSFADGTTDTFELDYLTVTCDRLSSPSWQEVKGSSEIHISSNVNEHYFEQSLCGDASVDGRLSICSEFLNDLSYWNKTWGYIHDQLNFINNYHTNIDESEEYETPLGQDCTSLIDITQTRNNITTSIIENVSMQSGSKDNCILHIPLVFNSSDREFWVDIYEDNYMRWEAQRYKDFSSYFDKPINKFCDTVALQNNNPFTIPIDSLGGNVDISTLYASNSVYLECYRILDDLYWFDYYYQQSLGINVSGEFESYLLEIKYYYPDLLEHSQIIQSVMREDLFLNVETSCNSANINNINSYACAIMKSPDGIFSSQEGYIVENLSVINTFNSTVDTHYSYSTAKGIDCSAVFSVLKQNGTTTEIIDDLTFGAGEKNNCVLTMPINYVVGQPSYQIEIYMENYVLWDIYWARDNVNSWNDSIADFCNDVATNRSITYTLPINSSIEQFRNDSEVYFCYRAMDDLYWWYFFYDKLSTENYTVIGEIEGIHYESEFFWQRIFNDYNTVKTYQRNLNQLLILQDILDLRENTAQRVWNFTDRTLTSDSTNYTLINEAFSNNSLNMEEIALSVWSYNGTIHPNILSQFAVALWNYTSTISNSILSSITSNVWSAQDRNLTYYPSLNQSDINYTLIGDTVWNQVNRTLTDYNMTDINYTLIQEMTWNASGRYVHGIINS